MTSPTTNQVEELVGVWPLPYGATLGSSTRSKGIFLEVRARLPLLAKKSLTIKARELTLRMARSHSREFDEASTLISAAMEGIENLPVIPREVEDVLAINSTERRRWLNDGRLPSAGTRTVKLRGRARAVTFHVFDPRVVEDILDKNLVERWRGEDAEKAAEKRRLVAWKARRTRGSNKEASAVSPAADGEERFALRGLAEFERDGPVR